MKATTWYQVLISAGVAVGIVATVEGPLWVALSGWAVAYAAAGAYRHATRAARKRKGGRR